jgi:protein-disulfide isomerase
MQQETESADTGRRRGYQVAALLVTAVVAGAVIAAILSSGSTSELRPGRPVPGAPRALAPLRGIPQSAATLGDPRAPVTLVEFADLQCPTCASFAEGALPRIISRYVRTGRVRLILYAIDTIGHDSERAARVAYAIGEQDRLFQFVALMYANQGSENTSYVTDLYLRALAGAIPGVDVERALAARNGAGPSRELARARALASSSHVSVTPSFLLYRTGSHPRRFSPAGLDAGSFAAAIQRVLGRAGA